MTTTRYPFSGAHHARSKHVREYRTRDGRQQFKPSIQLVMALNGAEEITLTGLTFEA